MLRRSILRVVLTVTFVASPLAAQSSGAKIKLLDFETAPPATWTPRKPSSSSRLAEFVVPTTPAGAAEVVVYFFGKSMGSNVQANVERWRGQFSTPDGSPVVEMIARDTTLGKLPVTTAEFRGTYRRGIGMGSADSVKTGQTLIASIIETPSGVMFAQLFGDSRRVADAKAEFVRFVRDLK